jgi:hypothetical protein
VRTVERLTETDWQSYYDIRSYPDPADWDERWGAVRSETRVPVRLITSSGFVEREFWPFPRTPIGVR